MLDDAKGLKVTEEFVINTKKVVKFHKIGRKIRGTWKVGDGLSYNRNKEAKNIRTINSPKTRTGVFS